MKVFVFHRVHPRPDPLWPPMRPGTFRRLVEFIAARHDVLPLEAFLAGEAKPRRRTPAAIVFDDGYSDFADFALPVLREKGLPSSMYVVTDCADTGRPIWTYRFDWALQHTRVDRLDIPPIGDAPLVWRIGAERLSFARIAKARIKAMEHKARETLLERIFAQLGDADPPAGLMMTWDRLRGLGPDVEIGSHTVSHPLLATMADATDIRFELTRSRDRIATEIGRPPRAIAYPNGSYDARVARLAQQAGYRFGLATEPRAWRPGDNPFEVPRIELYEEPMWKARARVLGLIDAAKRVKRAAGL